MFTLHGYTTRRVVRLVVFTFADMQFPHNFPIANVPRKSPTCYGKVGDNKLAINYRDLFAT